MSVLMRLVPEVVSSFGHAVVGGVYQLSVRNIIRYHFPRPSERKRILRHGWKQRMSTPAGRRVLMNRILKGSILLVTRLAGSAEGCKGCVSLDEYNFDKIISRFEAVLVKFDVAYPYGDKHEVFTKLAEELVKNQDLILAEVGVKDYGDKENEQLALKFGITKDDLPAIRLFIKHKPEVEFPKTAEWVLDNLRNLIRDNTDIYIGLPGCLEKFDKLAVEFVNSGNKQKELEQAERAVNDVTVEEKNAANVYVKFMKKILENGISFVKQEYARLSKILKEGKVNEKKKLELSHRLNILRSFSLPRDEL